MYYPYYPTVHKVGDQSLEVDQSKGESGESLPQASTTFIMQSQYVSPEPHKIISTDLAGPLFTVTASDGKYRLFQNFPVTHTLCSLLDILVHKFFCQWVGGVPGSPYPPHRMSGSITFTTKLITEALAKIYTYTFPTNSFLNVDLPLKLWFKPYTVLEASSSNFTFPLQIFELAISNTVTQQDPVGYPVICQHKESVVITEETDPENPSHSAVNGPIPPGPIFFCPSPLLVLSQ